MCSCTWSIRTAVLILYVSVIPSTDAWQSPSGGGYRRGGNHNGGGNNRRPRPGPSSSQEDGQPPNHVVVMTGLSFFGSGDDGENDTPLDTSFDTLLTTTHQPQPDVDDGTNCANEDLRGGASSANPKGLKNSKNFIVATSSYCANVIQSAQRQVTSIFKSKEQRDEDALMARLRTTPIQAVEAPNSTLLPNDVISVAAKRSGMIGHPLRIETVQEMAFNLKQWYTRKGYVLHAVTGAILQPDTATAELTVQEPTVSPQPVGITFCKEMIVDDDGSLVTYRQYRGKHASSKKSFLEDKIDKASLNTTYVQTTGRTDPRRLAKVLDMKPGRPFQWNGDRWQAIAGSGVFSRILRASPEPMRDGTVQLHILATEGPPRNLEYGVSKSLYTGSWEGEVDFEHNNLLGGGESLELLVRRGAKDTEPSVRLQYSDDKFGLDGGYNVELFSDFIGDSEDDGMDESGSPNNAAEKGRGALLDRRGASVRLRNPVSSNWFSQSTASACLERTSTVSGHHEAIASTTMGVGPLRMELPLEARSNLSLKMTTGTRVMEGNKAVEISGKGEYRVKPYSTATGTTRLVFPVAQSTENRRPVTLALQHSATVSTFNLPRHEANALGHGSTLRGYSMKANGSISSSVTGTTEIRVPITLPTDKLRQDASVVLFGDWLFAKKTPSSPLFRRSCVGVGIRKSFQGMPVRYDVSLTEDGKIGASFGLGRDFDV